MSRKNRNKNKNKPHVSNVGNDVSVKVDIPPPETIGGMLVVEEKFEIPDTNIEDAERNPIKLLDTSAEKLKSMPQIFIEDTFDVFNNVSNVVVIENTVKIRNKQYITKEVLLKNSQFITKFERLKKKIIYDKGFNELLDFVKLSKMYRRYYIDDTTDEIDILLGELINFFKKRLITIQLSFEDYQKIDAYFESLSSLYRRFNHGEGAIKDSLKLELEKLYSANSFIRYHLF